MADIQTAVEALGYDGDPLTSGANVYRVTYVTTRGNGEPGYSSALVYAPDTPRAETLPVVVAAHGSRGQAGICAPSLGDEAAAGVQEDFHRLVYPLVGMGYVVIAPDYAGYANFGAEGNPPSAYAHGLDAPQSTLDAVAAVRHLFPSVLSDDVVLVGHSLGGHTVLAALAAAETYAVDGTIQGAAVYSPLWISPLLLSLMIYSVPAVAYEYNLQAAPAMIATNIFYHWSHAELLMGAGAGSMLFAESVRTEMTEWVNSTCWSPSYPDLETLGPNETDYVFDYYDETAVAPIVQGIAQPLATSSMPSCESLGTTEEQTTCGFWLLNYMSDRPSIPESMSEVPIRLFYGAGDTTLSPSFMLCAQEKLEADGANLNICVEPDADDHHSQIVSQRAEYVGQWIGSLTLGEPDVDDCIINSVNMITGANCSGLPNP